MEYFVYILYSNCLDKFYTGQTDNLEKRLTRHNAGHGKYTKKGIPWTLAWSKQVESRSEAIKLEQTIKKRGAKRFIEDLSSTE